MELLLNLIALCFTLAGIETLQGIIRNAFIAPKIGTKKAKQLSLISGTLLAFIVCYFWIPNLEMQTTAQLFGVGLVLSIFMALFDVILSRYIIKLKWKVVLNDFNLMRGNFLLIGLLILSIIPIIVMRVYEIVKLF
jgi:hypothetical protein